jgi:TATA-box binding protein (TBP) (component of TFIID and TFIIIB)
MSKKKKDFYNQVTFTIRLPMSEPKQSILVSCKIFHNGTLHVTGTHSLEEATLTSNLLLERLRKFQGTKMVELVPNVPYLASHDNLLYSIHGAIVGWYNHSENDANVIYLKNEYVVLDNLLLPSEGGVTTKYPVFVSQKWNNAKKRIYTLDGELLGSRNLHFNQDIARRHFDVKFGYIYAGHKIVGKEETQFEENHLETLEKTEPVRRYMTEKGLLLHRYTSFNGEKGPLDFTPDDFCTHMINMFFKAPFKICRKRLHRVFLENGYYSRFDPCSNAAVNLRFHYNPITMANPKERGKCALIHQRTCNCKDISVSCFNSGKMNVTGLATHEQGHVVYEFLKDFFLRERQKIFTNE